ncbi:MAG: M17 family peptidase N-terminal domain-containing protein, partial [Nocardioides sp.]
MVSQAPSEAISVVATGLPPEQIEAEIVVLGVFADVSGGPDEQSRDESTHQSSGCRSATPLSSHLAAAFEGYHASGRTGAVGDDLVTGRRPGDEFAAGEVWWIGLGDPAGLTADALREVYTRLGRRVATAHHPVRTVAVVPPQIPGAAARDLSESSVLAAVVNGATDGLYRFERYRSTPVPPPATLLV